MYYSLFNLRQPAGTRGSGAPSATDTGASDENAAVPLLSRGLEMMVAGAAVVVGAGLVVA